MADPGGAEVAGGAARVRVEEEGGERRCCDGGERGEKREKRLSGKKENEKSKAAVEKSSIDERIVAGNRALFA